MQGEINTGIVLRLRGGDEKAFEKIFKSFFEPIVKFAREYVDDMEVSKNISQTVFMTLWEKRNSIEPNKSLRAYLYTLTRNLCISHLRHLKAENSYLQRSIRTYEDFQLNLGALSMLNFDAIDLDAIESIITRTIDSLPDRCREVFLLSRFEGLKNTEIALQKNITVKAVEANITRALKILKENLKDYLPSGVLTWLLEQLF